MTAEIRAGQQQLSDGVVNTGRAGKDGSFVVQASHGRFQEAALRNNLYSGGMTLTSIANVTFTTGTLGPTATPIVGIWNPVGSGRNAVILQAKLQAIITALQVTGGGAFMWCYSTGNGAISTGNTPLSRLTMTKGGSVCKDMSGIALTGLTNNLTIGEASGLQGGPNSNVSVLQTAASLMPSGFTAIDNLDAGWVVPPGGVLALLSTSTPVAVSAATALLWEEVSLIVS